MEVPIRDVFVCETLGNGVTSSADRICSSSSTSLEGRMRNERRKRTSRYDFKDREQAAPIRTSKSIMTVVLTHSGPSSVCFQFRDSGTTLSSAMSISLRTSSEQHTVNDDRKARKGEGKVSDQIRSTCMRMRVSDEERRESEIDGDESQPSRLS